MAQKEWEVPTGTMRVQITHSLGRDSETLLAVGSRHNPKRPFVFVSQVLGKHIPCSPHLLRTIQDELVVGLGGGTALIIGMAETATGLGEGVFAAFLRAGGDESLYLSTTRYPLDGHQSIEFSESHSHATRLVLHVPQSARGRHILTSTTRVILVDDELSTGATFTALVRALQALAPRIAEIDIVTLTDFSGGKARASLLELSGIERVDVHAQLTGAYVFETSAQWIDPPPTAQRQVSCRRHLMIDETPRLGITRAPAFNASLIDQCAERASQRPAVVVATGEFMYAAQWLGERLENRGIPTLVQSTTRSPLMLGGAIKNKFTVPDPYGEGIDNYIYNFNPGQACVFVVHETGLHPSVTTLCRDLNALSVDMRRGVIAAGDDETA